MLDPAAGAPGAVELREDLPLKAAAGAGGAWCAGGPRLVLGCFAALSAGITLALAAQVRAGSAQLVPHGSVASGAAACSRAGTDALKAGGRALDAAAAAALCLAVLAPHRVSPDASGALLHWEYRSRAARARGPALAEWGGAGDAPAGPRPPRLLAALAALHAELGALPWPRVLQPAVDLARGGFPVSAGLAAALAAAGGPAPEEGSLRSAPALADYLESLQRNTSAELVAAWGDVVRRSSPAALVVGSARLWAGGALAGPALRAVRAALDPPPAGPEDAQDRAARAMALELSSSNATVPGGVGSGLAVVDQHDTYAALVMGLSQAFGAGEPGAGGAAGAGGWRRDSPAADLDLAPALITDSAVCGTRRVVGAESGGALAQVAAALAAGGGPAAVERARAALGAPAAAVNVVQQAGDELLSHADSRAGGLASRF